jgi:hypothetical protein
MNGIFTDDGTSERMASEVGQARKANEADGSRRMAKNRQD